MNPPLMRSLVDIVGSRYRETGKQREKNVAYVNSTRGLIKQEAAFCPLVCPLCVFFFHFGRGFILVPSTKQISIVLPASLSSSSTVNIQKTHLHPRVRAAQYIFCRLGSTASLRKENTRRIPDLFPLLPLVK